MKIVVVGAGAMGSLFGALLSRTDHDVLLYDVWAEHVQAIREKGLSVEREGRSWRARVRATADPEEIGIADLMIIFVKATRTDTAAETVKRRLAQDGLVLTLQNGLGNADILSRHMGPERVLAGTTAHGATLLGPGRVRHAGEGPTLLGFWSQGQMERAGRIAGILNKAGIETRVVEDARGAVWEKLLVNVGINAVTALTGIRNGQLLDLACTRELVRAAVEEAMAVAGALGIAVREDSVEHVFEVARATEGNRSSMGQDVDNGRQTEIKVINGAIVREGEKLGMNVPVNRTLAALIETLEAHYGQNTLLSRGGHKAV